MMTAGAGLTLGLFFGFLFAVPRSSIPSPEQPGSTSDRAADRPGTTTRLLPNSNLEQVSDWLTKIVIGVSLVQFHDILGAMSDLAGAYAGALSEDAASDRLMAGAMLVFYPAFGFLTGYLGTRTMVTILLTAVPLTGARESVGGDVDTVGESAHDR
jgi:hypothetical protein